MRHCIALSSTARQQGYSPVGAVIVQEESIIAEAFEGEAVLPLAIAHAEMIAICKAIQQLHSMDLSSCRLYSTKEPCVMCAYLIRKTGISQVIYASPTEELGSTHSQYPILTTPLKKWFSPPEVISGVLKEEYELFFKQPSSSPH